MSKPAPKPVDAILFRDTPPEVRNLNRQGRKELRQSQRATYAKIAGIRRPGGV